MGIDAENARLQAIAEAEEAEQERIAGEARAAQEAKRKEHKDKIEEKKKAGTYMTKRQLAEHKLRQKKRAQMIADGIIKPEDISDGEAEDDNKKGSHVIKKDRKKNKKHNQKEQEEMAEN